MKSEFRPTAAQDAPAIATFLQRVFPMDPGHPTTNLQNLQWKYWDECPNWPGSRSYVTMQDDNITAHGCVVPLNYRWGDRSLKVAHLIDWAAEPKSVGSGITLLKRIGHEADAVMSFGGSEKTRKILPALGFKSYGQVTRYALPIRPLRHMAGREGPTWKLGAKFLRSLLWSWQAPSGKVPGWEVRRVMPEQLVAAAIPWPKPSPGMAVLERTGEMMRYFLRCPSAPMEFYTVSKETAVRGYFVLAYAPAQARLVDFWMDSADPGDWRVLVRLAVQQARRNGNAAEVVSMGNDPVTQQSLLDGGFHARGSVPLSILVAKGSELPEAPVRIQMLDGDAAYFHSGQPDFWA